MIYATASDELLTSLKGWYMLHDRVFPVDLDMELNKRGL